MRVDSAGVLNDDGTIDGSAVLRVAAFPARFDRRLRIRIAWDPAEHGRFELEFRYSAPGESKAGGSLIVTIDREPGASNQEFVLDTRTNEFFKPGVHRFSVRVPTGVVLARIPIDVRLAAEGPTTRLSQ